MARSPDVIVDRSPLDSPVIDVRLRVGWLLRSCRLNSGATAGMAGNAFAKEVGVNPAQVTKWEKASEDVDPVAIEAYERFLGRPPGSMRGVVEMSRRIFRQPATGRNAAPRRPEDLDELSMLVWPAMHGDPRGIDWLHFADALNADGPLALPLFTAEPVIDRLTSEMARSVETAFTTRYEALARLRSGPYRTVTLKSVLGLALARDSQIAVELLEVAGELPSAQLFADMCRLLVDTRRPVFEGACRALVNMVAIGGIGPGDLQACVPALAAGYNAVCVDSHRHQIMSGVLRNLPTALCRAVIHELDRPLAPLRLAGELTRDGAPYVAAQQTAMTIKRELASREDEVLERVLFEALFDPVWVKRYMAKYFLISLPYKDLVVHVVTELGENHPMIEVRRAAAQLLMQMGSGAGVVTAERWALSDDPDTRNAGLASLGNWGGALDPALLNKVVSQGWEIAQRGLYAAGMSGSPVLGEWANDVTQPEEVRAAARWWLRHGSRITG